MSVRRLVLAAALAMGPAMACAADSPNLLEQGFFVALGSYVVDTNTDVRLDGELDEDRFAVDLDVAKDRFDGSLDWAYQGPMLFYSATF